MSALFYGGKDNDVRLTKVDWADDEEFNILIMRKIFYAAQQIQKNQKCIQSLDKLMKESNFDEFYSEFCRNLKCTLKYNFENPNVKNILDMISSFLLSLKRNYNDLNLKRKNHFHKESINNCKKSKTYSITKNNENEVPIDELNFLIFIDENNQIKIGNINSSISNSRPVNLNSTRLKSSNANKLKDSTNNLKNFSNKSTKSTNKSSTNINKDNKDNQIYKLYSNLLDSIIDDILIPFLQSINENTRLNSCFLLSKLINSIEDLETNLFFRLKSSIIERLIDKNSNVRSAAALLLYRFQDKSPNDAILNNTINRSTNSSDRIDNLLNNHIRENQDVEDALLFHLKYDPSPSVRLNCLNVILINNNILPIILTKIRDINNAIREKTFIKLSKKINFKQLKKDDKLFIMKNGLNDRKKNVTKAFKDYCIPAWIRSYNNNLIDLIIDLDLDINHELIEQFLINYFDLIYSKNKILQFNKFHQLIIDFCKNYLDNEFLIKKENYNCEIFFLWTNLIKYLKKKEFESDEQIILDKKIENDLRSKLKNQFISVFNNQSNEYTLLKDKSNDQLNCDNILNDKNELNNEPIYKNQIKNDKIYILANAQSVDENNNESEIIGLSETINIPPIQQANKHLINNNQTINLPIINNHDLNQSDNNNDYSLVDLILPKFTKFIQFFKLFFFQLNDRNYDNDKELLINQLMFKQSIHFLVNYEINDNFQKSLILQLIDELINLDNNVINLVNYIDELINYLYQNVIKDKKEFFEYSFELQNKLELNIEQDKVIDHCEIKIKLDDIRKLEVINANKAIRMHELKDQLDNVIMKCEYDKAHEIQKEIELIKEECGKLNEEINKIKDTFNNQNNKIKNNNENDNDYLNLLLIKHPVQHFKLIKLFKLTINFCSPTRFNSIIDAKFEKYVLSGILSENSKIRYAAIEALNELSYLNLEIANKFYPLYARICLEDNEENQALALKGLIDFIMEHGLDVLFDNSKSNDNNEIYNDDVRIDSILNNNLSNNNITSFINKQLDLPNTSIRTTISSNLTNKPKDLNEELINKSHFIESTILNQDINQTNQIELNKQITKEFIKFILNFVKSNNELIKSTAVMSVCKLAFLRIYSPKLLSELILLYYNSSTSQSIKQDIGSFLPIYCLAESTFKIKLPSNISGQNCLSECFMCTVENFYHLERGEQLDSSFDIVYSNYYDSDINISKVIEFMLNLLEEKNHYRILLQFFQKILEIMNLEREDEYQLNERFITRYLIPSLDSFKLLDITNEKLNNLKNLMKDIKSSSRYKDFKQSIINKLVKFDDKLQLI